MIGLDGLEIKVIEAMLAQGELPNLAALRARGGLGTVATTTPAQTPVAWSTFATGLNPGGHGIFDFLRRDPKTYLPDLALNRYEQKNAFSPPKAVNSRKGETIWDRLTAAGVPSTIIRCPCMYPPENIKGRLLAGMGVPDLRGGLGTATYYTSRTGVSALEAENVVTCEKGADGSYVTHLIGPRIPKDRSDARADIVVVPDPSGDRVTIRSSGTPRDLPRHVRIDREIGLHRSVRSRAPRGLRSSRSCSTCRSLPKDRTRTTTAR